jgi:acetyl esterase/lipase
LTTFDHPDITIFERFEVQQMTHPTFPLWDGQAPGALGTDPKDTPSITVYPAQPGSRRQNPPHPAMVILPGGGYRFLAQHEGPAYAEWLSEQGFTCFVVQYRLAVDGYRWPVMLWDAARAMRWVRCHASDWDVDPQRIGMIGASAGAHLLASLATHYDDGNPASADPVERAGSRPTLGVLCYGPFDTSLMAPNSDFTGRMLGPDPTPELVESLSPVHSVSASTPPCFLMHTVADEKVSVLQTLSFAAALHRAGVPFEVHIYEKGAHGIAVKRPHPWPAECVRWLNEQFA